jgi:hypothetical protein
LGGGGLGGGFSGGGLGCAFSGGGLGGGGQGRISGVIICRCRRDEHCRLCCGVSGRGQADQRSCRCDILGVVVISRRVREGRRVHRHERDLVALAGRRKRGARVLADLACGLARGRRLTLAGDLERQQQQWV